MEKNSAACAMDWSIELEKALRSKNPNRAVEAILEMGPRLEQWNREPQSTMAAYNMFGLVPGEDRLFANTILLRLAEAFRSGDRNTRLAVVKVFLSERRRRKSSGILSKPRLRDQMLARVAAVFHSGDMESRALSLALIGYWAHFGIHSAQIRYLILSTLVSSHVLEVKAALFAVGCFCELSDDFATVALDILVHMVTSSETLPAVRLAGLRVFAKMGCSYSIANRAYKAGLKLVLTFSEEDFVVAMLVSLTKLASTLTVLISEQMELLFSFLTREKTLRLKETALRCLRFIFMKGVCQFPVDASTMKTLFIILDEPDFPSALQFEALQILHKILLYSLPNLHGLERLELAKPLTIVEKASQCSNMSTSLLAIRILADLSSKLNGRMAIEVGGVCNSFLPSQVISLSIDRMTLFVKSQSIKIDFEVFQDVQSLLKIIALLIGEHSNLGVLVLDKIYLFIESLVNMRESNMATRQEGLLVHEILEFGGGMSQVMRLKLAFTVCKFVSACLENLKEAGAITTQVFDRVKAMVKCIHQCGLFDCYTHTIYSLLLHSQIIWGCKVHEDKENGDLDKNSSISLQECLVKREIITLECAKKMLAEKNYWPAYRAGAYAACQGAWFTAAFIFEQLIKKVQSESNSFWLKSLVQFAHSEGKLQTLIFPKQGHSLENWLEVNKFPITFFKDDSGDVDHDIAGNICWPNYIKKLVRVYHGIYSSGETLDTAVSLDQTFFFQRWFLAVRAKVLGAVVDVLKVLGAIQLGQDDISNGKHVDKSLMAEHMKVLQQITPISYRFKRLAQECDLIATSFIDMDSTSSKIISALALSCSLFGFITGFTFFNPKLPVYETFKTCGLESLENCLHSMLVQNLSGRMWHTNCECVVKLNVLLGISGQSEKCSHLPSRNQILNVSCEARGILIVCKDAITGIQYLQDVANRVHNEEILSQVIKDGVRFLLDIIMRWLCIPSRMPKYFFKLRPCIGSELFAFNADTSNLDGISVLSGSHLSLNLCLQLKNVPPGLLFRLTKLYCILYCRVSDQVPRPTGENSEHMRWSYRAWESDDLVEMNEMLLCYVECKNKPDRKRGRNNDDGDDRIVKAFVHFEPNESRQGFSNCLLDVSHFPVGSYRMKWQSCCIDSRGTYCSLLPLNAGPIFTVLQSHTIS